MANSPIVSIVIPAYGRTDLLEKSVRSALAQDFDPKQFEVIVVDTSADDGNARMIVNLQQEAPCRLLFFRKKPEGPGPSRNLGVKESRSEYLAFLDSDCWARPDWLREGLSRFQEGMGLVQGKIIPDPEVPHSVFNRSIEVYREAWCYETANIFYRREAFDQVGGFIADPKGHSLNYALGGEDVDLAWKVKRAGWKSCFAENAVVAHNVARLPLWRWIIQIRMGSLPLVVATNPEIRRFFYARYFFDQAQALVVLALLGLVGGFFYPAALLLILPYFIKRATEPSKTLKGPMRLLRVVLYFPRDLATFGALLLASIRYRALLL